MLLDLPSGEGALTFHSSPIITISHNVPCILGHTPLWLNGSMAVFKIVCCCLKKNQNAPRASELVVVFFTLTDRASTKPSNIRGCQSGTWSQRGTKVKGSHHGDNPLLRPTGIQIATKSYATLQPMAPTNSKTVHQTSVTPYREQPRSTRIDCCRLPTTSVLINKSDKYVPTSFDQQEVQVSQGHTSYKNKKN